MCACCAPYGKAQQVSLWVVSYGRRTQKRISALRGCNEEIFDYFWGCQVWIDEYLSLMGAGTITLEAINAARELKGKNLPDQLFKFRGVDNYALDNLENDSVWMCSPTQYNDPYDCACTWSTEALWQRSTMANIEKILNRPALAAIFSANDIKNIKGHADPIEKVSHLLLAKTKDRTSQQIADMVAVVTEGRRQLMEETIVTMNRHIQEIVKVCSFSTRLDSSVMWGHYARSHTGFVIEYDVKHIPPDDMRRMMLMPVVYRKELYNVTEHMLQAAGGGTFNNLFSVIAAMHKAPEWKYEEEWRFVSLEGAENKGRNIFMPTPTAVYLGSKISTNDHARIASIAKKKNIALYKMELSAREFKLIPGPQLST